MSARPSARLRFLLSCAALPAIAVLGALAAVCIPPARADVLPTLPTVTLPVTVPALPIGTTGTTIAPATGTTATTTTSTSVENGRGAAADSSIAGAIRLPSGAISVPISSVTAPVGLAIDRITISPSWIGVRGRAR